MTEATSVPHGRWMHSYEEDYDDVRVYRPADYDFPPARGRSGIEFRPDGTYVDWTIARGDGNEARPGRWEPIAGGHVRVTEDGGTRTLDVALVEPDRLEVRTGDVT